MTVGLGLGVGIRLRRRKHDEVRFLFLSDTGHSFPIFGESVVIYSAIMWVTNFTWWVVLPVGLPSFVQSAEVRGHK